MIKPEDFRKLAEELRERRQDEASLRTSISRVYYSAFHFIKLQLLVLFKDEPDKIKKYLKDIGHTSLQQVLGSISNDINSRQLSKALKNFHDSRVIADYELNKSVTFNDVQLSFSCYSLTLQLWNKIDKQSLKQEAIKNISIRLGTN